MLSGHLAVTAKHHDAMSDTILVLQDSTEFSSKHERPEAISLK
jgi:hypothetical protein